VARRRVPIRRLLSLARPELGILVVATVMLVLGSAMQLAFPLVVRWMVDLISEGVSPGEIDVVAGLLLGVFALSATFGGLRSYLFTLAGERVVARLRKDLFDAVIGQEVAFFDGTRTGELTNRLSNDTSVLQNTVTVNLSMALRFGAGAIGGVVMLVWMSPRLTGVTLAVVPVVAIGASLYGRLIRKLSSRVQDALAEAGTVAEESIAGLRTVRSFTAEDAERARYSQAVDDSYALAAKRAGAYGVFQGIAGFAAYGAIALVVWYGSRLVLDGTMTMGDLTAYLLYTLTVAMSLGALSGLWGDLMRATGASERVFELIDRDRGLEGAGGEDPGEVRGQVTLDGVTFAYPTRPDVSVLRDLSLDVSPGEVVALVGPSGAGKSTIAGLVLRFYDPGAGAIRLDGRDLTTLDPKAVRRHIGVVAQEPVLFASSIRDNVRYARPDAGDDEVRSALEAANALAFVEDFPDGLDTEVGERGVRLSGGQKQRIAIARALLADPRILILDEATSALDAENEHLVQEALDRLMKGRTTLVIAHRLSTVRGADRVVVLEDGQVAEQGGHDALVAQGGLYAKLVERQLAS